MTKVGFQNIIGDSGLFSDGDWVESKDQNVNGKVRLIQLADIGDGSFINKSSRFLTEKRAKELKCTFLEKGDVLIARMPDPLGRACVFPGLEQKAVTVVDVCIVRVDRNIVSPEWLVGKINSHLFRHEINKRVTGTTRLRISKGNLAKLKIDLPPLRDQIKIALILKKVEDLIAQRKKNLLQLDELVKSTFLDMFGDPYFNKVGYQVHSLNDITAKITDGEHGTVKRTESGRMYLMARNISAKGEIDLENVSFISEEDHQKIYKRCNAEYEDLLLVCVGCNNR